MNNSENQHYCPTHGTAIAVKWKSISDCRQCRADDLENALQKYNKTPWSESDWIKRDTKYPASMCSYTPRTLYVCHTCKYFMYHPTFYCCKCPNKLCKVKYSSHEMLEKLSDYREGY